MQLIYTIYIYNIYYWALRSWTQVSHLLGKPINYMMHRVWCDAFANDYFNQIAQSRWILIQQMASPEATEFPKKFCYFIPPELIAFPKNHIVCILTPGLNWFFVISIYLWQVLSNLISSLESQGPDSTQGSLAIIFSSTLSSRSDNLLLSSASLYMVLFFDGLKKLMNYTQFPQ